MSSSSSNVEDEIEAAFAGGAMPPEWRPRLLPSGLNGNDVDVIAAIIAKTHPILRTTCWSKEDVLFNASGVLVGLLLCLVAVVLGETKKGLMVTLLMILGLFYILMTLVISVFDEYKRRRAKAIREVARRVLENFLASPV